MPAEVVLVAKVLAYNFLWLIFLYSKQTNSSFSALVFCAKVTLRKNPLIKGTFLQFVLVGNF
jgi:hypothetical protein